MYYHLIITAIYMTVIGDSIMGMILPDDISGRIAEFVEGKKNFPFVERDEVMCIFYVYGMKYRVNGKQEVKEALDLAERTVVNMKRHMERYMNSFKRRLDSEFIRSQYLNRQLQLTVEKKTNIIKQQIFNDPVILSNCFAQHVSYYNQDYFFQIYEPFSKTQVIKDLQKYLVGRMVLLGYNRKDEKSLPFQHPIIPLYTSLKIHLTNSNSTL
jgi:hypothetical protein